MMRMVLMILLVGVLAPGLVPGLAPVLVLGPADARQGDDRLEGLFDQLMRSEERPEIVAAERRIWQIWHESGSDTIDLLMGQGIRLMRQGQHDDALAKFDTIIELAPDFAEGWNKRATIYYMIGEYGASVIDIVKTLELEPRHFGALSGLGLIYDAIDIEVNSNCARSGVTDGGASWRHAG